jgi:hypothetical protein
VNKTIEAAAKDAATQSANKLTPILRNMAIAANWPSDIVLSLTVKAQDGKLVIDYPETFEDRINDLEYGQRDQAPSAVLRSFVSRFASHLEEIMSNTSMTVLSELGVFN